MGRAVLLQQHHVSHPSPGLLSCSGTGGAGHAGGAAARSPPLPVPSPSGSCPQPYSLPRLVQEMRLLHLLSTLWGSQPPPSLHFALASLAVFEQHLWAGILHPCCRYGQAPAWPSLASSTAGRRSAESISALSRPQVQLGLPRHPSPSRQQSCCPLPTAAILSSSKEAPALEPAVYWAPVGTHLPFLFPFPPTELWRGPPTSAGSCHRHLVTEPGQGSRTSPGARGQLTSSLHLTSAPP